MRTPGNFLSYPILILTLIALFIGFSPEALAQGDPNTANKASDQAPAAVLDEPLAEPAAIDDPLTDTVKMMAQGGGNLWQEIVVPFYQRMGNSFPTLIKALLILFFFWIVARLLQFLTTKLFSLTTADEKVIKEVGLDKLLLDSKGKKRPFDILAGKTVKWLVMLFGFVAVLQILNLQMVAGPLKNVLDRILMWVPSLIKGFAILFIYWVLAAFLKIAIIRGLGAIDFDKKTQKYLPSQKVGTKIIGPSVFAGRLFFYVILLFAIPPFLQALGQESLVTPLQVMLSKGLGYLPNIIAAAVIFFVGYIIATVVREIFSNFLSALGADAGAETLGISKIVGKKKLSEVAGTVIYFFILIPVIVSAVDALSIKAISDPIKATLEKVLAAIPAVLAATVIIIVGYIIAKLVKGLVETFLNGIGFDSVPDKLGLTFLKPKQGGASLSTTGGAVVMIVILLLTAQEALATLGFLQMAGLVNTLILYLPNLVVGLVIFFASLSIGTYLGSLVTKATAGSGHSALVGTVAKYAIIFFGASIALNHMGVGEEIITVTVSAVLGGTALALGLAFGLGGKDRAKAIIEKNFKAR